MPDPKLVRLFSHGNSTQVYVILGVLRQGGIEAEVRGEALSVLGGGIPFADARAEVWIAADRVDEACALLGVPRRPTDGALSLADGELFGRLSRPAGGELALAAACHACGTAIEEGFDACWSCGRDL